MTNCQSLRQLLGALLLASLLATAACGKKKEVYESCDDVANRSDLPAVMNNAYDLSQLRLHNRCEFEATTCYYVESDKYLWFECYNR